MMEANDISEALGFNSEWTWLIVREDLASFTFLECMTYIERVRPVSRRRTVTPFIKIVRVICKISKEEVLL
jgi:hypothetical protein